MVAFSTKSSMCFTFPIVTAGSRAGSIAKIFVVGGDCTVADVEVTDNVRGFVVSEIELLALNLDVSCTVSLLDT